MLDYRGQIHERKVCQSNPWQDKRSAEASQGPMNGRQAVTWDMLFIIFLKNVTKLAGVDWALEERQVLNYYFFLGKI